MGGVEGEVDGVVAVRGSRRGGCRLPEGDRLVEDYFGGRIKADRLIKGVWGWGHGFIGLGEDLGLDGFPTEAALNNWVEIV